MRTFQFLPYFVLGSCLTQDNLSFIRQNSPFKIIIGILGILCVLWLVNNSGSNLCAINFAKYGLIELHDVQALSYFQTLGFKLLVNVMSQILSLAILAWFKSPLGFCENGNSTLFILCSHIPFYYLITRICPNFYIGLILGALIIVVLTKIYKTKYSSFILYPVSSLYNYFKNET